MEKIAVIDIGSNSIRVVFAYVLPSKHFVVFDEIKESVRLGQDFESDGLLKKSRVEYAVKTLKMFKKMCNSYDVDKVYAVATNALRRAKNQKSFIEEVNSSCGFKVNVLTEEDEAHKIYYGVVNSLEIPKGVILDISGSTFQLIHYNRRNILNRENLHFGSISLTEMLEHKGLKPYEQAEEIEQFVMERLKNIEWLKQIDSDTLLVGVGGSFRNIASINQKITKYPLSVLHNYNVSKTDFSSIYDMVKVLDIDKKATIKGLSSERADIFSAALSTIKVFFDITKFENIIISSCGLREGILYNYSEPSTLEKPITDIVLHSIYSKLNFFDENKEHAEKVHSISLLLYRELKVLHKLPRFYIRILKVASLLHDCGARIRFYEHPRHSLYFILNCGINGVSHRELVLAGFVAALHNGLDTNLSSDWQRYKDIVLKEDWSAVCKLSIILRMAEGFDRSFSGGIKDIRCDILGDSVIMKTIQEGECSLEIREASNCSVDFAKIFKKNLEIL